METIRPELWNDWQRREAERCKAMGLTPCVSIFRTRLEPNDVKEFVTSEEITNIKTRSPGDVYGDALFASVRVLYCGKSIRESYHPARGSND